MSEEIVEEPAALPVRQRKLGDLTEREKAFCHQFVISGGRVREAYRLVFQPKKGTTVAMIGRACAELLSDDLILDGIEQVRKSSLITAQSVLQEMSYIAFSDPGELFDDDGKCIPIRQLPRNVRAAIAGFEIERRTRGRGEEAEEYDVLKYKLWNKNDAASDLMRHLGLFEKDNLQKSGIENLLNRLPVAVAEQIIEKLKAMAGKQTVTTALLPPPKGA